jgi:hypothetical protein
MYGIHEVIVQSDTQLGNASFIATGYSARKVIPDGGRR